MIHRLRGLQRLKRQQAFEFHQRQLVWMVQIFSTKSVSTRYCARSAPRDKEGVVGRRDLTNHQQPLVGFAKGCRDSDMTINLPPWVPFDKPATHDYLNEPQ